MGGSKKPQGNSLATLTAARWGLLSRRAQKLRVFSFDLLARVVALDGVIYFWRGLVHTCEQQRYEAKLACRYASSWGWV